MNTLQKRINELNREQLFEAAQFLSLDISDGKLPSKRENEVLVPFSENSFENIKEYENLAKIFLLEAAELPSMSEKIDNAIQSTGKKQLILGSSEIIMLAGLFLVGMQIILSKGASSVDEKIEIEESKGKKVIKINKKTTYGISSMLGSILKQYFGN